MTVIFSPLSQMIADHLMRFALSVHNFCIHISIPFQKHDIIQHNLIMMGILEQTIKLVDL